MDAPSLVKRWFADELLLGRALSAVGGYLGAHLMALAYGNPIGFFGIAGLASAVAGAYLLTRHQRGLLAAALILGGAGLAVAFTFFPWGPALSMGPVLLVALILTAAVVTAPARNTRVLPRIAATAIVLVTGAVVLGFAALEAWVLWAEAFSLTLPLDQTYAILREDERNSVTSNAQVWAIATTMGFAVLVIAPFVPALRFGVRRIAAVGASYIAASLVTVVFGSWPVGWNLTDYGAFETEDYRWHLLVRLLQVTLFAAALLFTALRAPEEVRAVAATPLAEAESAFGKRSG